MKSYIIKNAGMRIKYFIPFLVGVWARSVNPNIGIKYLVFDLVALLVIGLLLDLIHKDDEKYNTKR